VRLRSQLYFGRPRAPGAASGAPDPLAAGPFGRVPQDAGVWRRGSRPRRGDAAIVQASAGSLIRRGRLSLSWPREAEPCFQGAACAGLEPIGATCMCVSGARRRRRRPAPLSNLKPSSRRYSKLAGSGYEAPVRGDVAAAADMTGWRSFRGERASTACRRWPDLASSIQGRSELRFDRHCSCRAALEWPAVGLLCRRR